MERQEKLHENVSFKPLRIPSLVPQSRTLHGLDALMLIYVVRRLLLAIPTLLLISMLVFAVVQLQPGGFLSNYLDDPRFSEETVRNIKRQFGLDQPLYIQYWNWLTNIVFKGDFGFSFQSGRPVSSIIWERVGWTLVLATLTLVITWLIAIPLGIATALRRRGVLSTGSNFLGYMGLATPDFLIALLLIYLVLSTGGTSVGGLFSPQYIDAPWSWERFINFLSHLWIPIVAMSAEGLAGLMRQMRANLLDVLGMDYVRTARAKGLAERVVIYRHAVRNAINPMISLAGLSLPQLISSDIVVAKLLSLPTMGPLLLDSLFAKDQQVAMAILMLSAVLLVVGNLLADIALSLADPRIRYD
ncbi:ABC transporter permease [uncultured Meiothermus sp.]|jgi:peptide/nickel transport system permease protein|uniref:ABC transporter permease n=1 Tax=uncultured Meiothermus sp. TaxID=157471 RepID=UPI0026375ACA|nr:ABC transporter permease [uncultured Meiothermus sp.]